MNYSPFEQLPSCPFFCQGHADPSTYNMHSTDLDYFGEDGPVGVTQTDGAAPVVSLFDLPAPQVDFSPAEARQVAYQMLLTADIAERAALSTPTAAATRALGEALAAREHMAGAR